MHYKNGREAKIGDLVVFKTSNVIRTGIVVNATAESDTCNLQITPLCETLYYSTASECLHADDALGWDKNGETK